MTLSAVIITKNEAKNIARCLDSLENVADEVIILDAFSTDETANICNRYPSVIFVQREWEGYAASKNYADSIATGDYILSLDADEELSIELQKNITAIKPFLDGKKAFHFNRLNHIAGEPIHYSGWYPDRKLRLFPKKTSEWVGDFAHETLNTSAEITHLKGDLWHYTSPSFTQMAEKQRQYAELGAHELYKKGKHISALKRFFKVFFKFFSIFILKLGFLDGKKGFKIALISAKYLNHKFKFLSDLEKGNKL